MLKIKAFLKKHRKLVIFTCIVLIIAVPVLTALIKSPVSSLVEEQAVLRDIHTYRSFVGNVEPATDTAVISKVSQQVIELPVKLGDSVKEGNVIAVLESTTLEQNIALKKVALNSSNTTNSYNVSDAQRNYDNFKYALDNGLNGSLVSARLSADNAKTAYAKAKSEYDTRAAAIDSGNDPATQSEYSAVASANAAYTSAESELKTAQSALDAALSAAGVTEAEVEADPAKYAAEHALVVTRNDKRTVLAAKTSALTSAQSAFATAKTVALAPLKSVADSTDASYGAAQKSYDVAKLAAQQQLESYAAALDKIKATSNTTSTRLELANMQKSLKDYTITAPCDGTITALNVTKGGMVSGGATVATISNLSAMQVLIRVDEYSILDTGEGSPVSILIDATGRTYSGKISRVSDVATLNNGVSYFEATVKFTADGYAKSGMSVEVRLTSADVKDAVSVSAGAVRYNDDNTAYLLVQTSEGKQEIRNVETGVSDGSYVEIVSGLYSGEIVLAQAAADFVMPEMQMMQGHPEGTR
ncbi:MAG: efflux RND transporter periplasmic adaptor subunit [Oscillospiraceae bacterium]